MLSTHLGQSWQLRENCTLGHCSAAAASRDLVGMATALRRISGVWRGVSAAARAVSGHRATVAGTTLAQPPPYSPDAFRHQSWSSGAFAAGTAGVLAATLATASAASVDASAPVGVVEAEVESRLTAHARDIFGHAVKAAMPGDAVRGWLWAPVMLGCRVPTIQRRVSCVYPGAPRAEGEPGHAARRRHCAPSARP